VQSGLIKFGFGYVSKVTHVTDKAVSGLKRRFSDQNSREIFLADGSLMLRLETPKFLDVYLLMPICIVRQYKSNEKDLRIRDGEAIPETSQRTQASFAGPSGLHSYFTTVLTWK